ncbi:hypothetical protein QQS21_007411 [Conoideocrella luteorostrata]|uniref:Uncharacterized protein n=1 Tax=Conoideocrella luteorostrata TaxID=1105319 RepID=A0AAJ0CQ33_9HYPO|nr:hypothetical protein QQS21_007411 [Conoideocrella luteorostrata]
MAETTAARARLRRTFRYPDESSEPETLDEQEQEALITQLSTQNSLQNTQFTHILLALPVVATIPYIPLLFRPRYSIIAILSITSLLASAYLLHKLPPTVTGIAPLDAWTRREDVLAASKDASIKLRHQARRLQRGLNYDKSPLETYLPYLNAALVTILVLTGLVTGRGAGSFSWVGMGNLPGIVYTVILLAKVVMGAVDPEKELSGLRYEYRGA